MKALLSYYLMSLLFISSFFLCLVHAGAAIGAFETGNYGTGIMLTAIWPIWPAGLLLWVCERSM